MNKSMVMSLLLTLPMLFPRRGISDNVKKISEVTKLLSCCPQMPAEIP
jgi:hypothetical protein